MADLFVAIFREKRGLVLILQAYLDESEREQAADPICVAGYLFKPTPYKQFRRAWQRHVLQRRRLRHFHMTDLFAGRGVYQDLSIPERIDILNHAVNAIAGNFYVGVGVHFDRVEFEAEAPKDWPRYFGSIYSVACQMCLQSTAFMRIPAHHERPFRLNVNIDSARW